MDCIEDVARGAPDTECAPQATLSGLQQLITEKLIPYMVELERDVQAKSVLVRREEEQRAALQAECDKLQHSVAAARAENERLADASKASALAIKNAAALDAALSAASTEKLTALATATRLDAQLAACRKELAALKQEADRTKADLTAKLADAQTALHAERVATSGLRRQVGEQRKQIEKLQCDADGAIIDKAEEQALHAALKVRTAKLQEAYDSLERKHVSLVTMLQSKKAAASAGAGGTGTASNSGGHAAASSGSSTGRYGGGSSGGMRADPITARVPVSSGSASYGSAGAGGAGAGAGAGAGGSGSGAQKPAAKGTRTLSLLYGDDAVSGTSPSVGWDDAGASRVNKRARKTG